MMAQQIVIGLGLLVIKIFHGWILNSAIWSLVETLFMVWALTFDEHLLPTAAFTKNNFLQK